MTGAGGYVGSRLIGHLHGSPVRALVRETVAHLDGHLQIPIDLLDPGNGLDQAFDGCSTVVHLASHNEISIATDPDRGLTETLLMARHVAGAAQRVGVERIVYVSTIHVYGGARDESGRVTEELIPEPTSVYPISRLTCEHLLREHGVDLVVLRLTNAVGPPAHVTLDRWTLVASDLCRQGAKDGRLSLRTAGLQRRDFVDLGDVADAITACSRPSVPPGIYNLGSGRSHTVRHLAEMVQDTFELLTGRRPPLDAPQPGPSDGQGFQVAVDRLAALGIEQRTPLESSVRDLATFCLDHKDRL